MRLRTVGWAVAGGLAAVLLAALGWGLGHPAQSAPPTIVGKPAPSLTISSLDGQAIELSKLRGTPLVVNFWASWCVPCRQEAPVLNSAAQTYAGRARFVGVDIQDSDQAARQYQAEVQSPYPAGPAVHGSYRDWGVTAPPETFFVNRQGLVVSRIAGPVDAGRLDIYLSQILA